MTDNEIYVPPADPGSHGPGARLRGAREAAKLSHEELAHRLHLKVEVLVALENDRFERLPEPAYVRGYLRACAKVLGIDEQPLLEAYAGVAPPEPKLAAPDRLDTPFQEVKGHRGIYVAALLLLLAMSGLFAYQFFGTASVDDGAVAPVEDDAASLPVVSGGRTPSLGLPRSPEPAGPGPEAAREAPAAVEAAVRPAVPVTPPVVPAPAPAPVTPPAVLLPDGDVLTIGVRRDSWVEVRDADNRVLITGTLSEGTERQVAGRPPLRVVVGNADGVRLHYDGRDVDLAPHVGRDRAARLTLPLE